MNILAVDTSALTASVALFKDGVSVFENNITSGLTHSETLMPMIDHALKSVKLTPKDIDIYAVAKGPGSFTGIRIGVAAIKALAYAADKKVCGVNTLLALANNAACTSNVPVSPIMDARRSQVYNAVYTFENSKPKVLTEPRAISIDELCGEVTCPTLFTGDGVRVYQDKIKALIPEYAIFAPPHMQLQKAACVAYAAMNADESEYILPENLDVIYLRKSQAEREREDKERKDLMK